MYNLPELVDSVPAIKMRLDTYKFGPREAHTVFFADGVFPVSDTKVQVVEMSIDSKTVRIANWSMATHDYHSYNIYFHPGGPKKLVIHQDDKKKCLEACAAYIVRLFKEGLDGISLEGLPVDPTRTDLMDYFCDHLSFFANQEGVALDIDKFKQISREQKWEHLQSTSFLCRKNFCQVAMRENNLINGSGRVYELDISGVSISLILAEVDPLYLLEFLETIKPSMDSAKTLMMGTIGANFNSMDEDKKREQLYTALKTFTGLCNPADRIKVSDDTPQKPDVSFCMTLSSFPATFLTAQGAINYATSSNQDPTNPYVFFQPQDPNPQATGIIQQTGSGLDPS